MKNKAEQLFDEGLSFYEQGNFENAEAKFIEALEFDPLSEEIKYNLALIYLETKKYDLCNKLISRIRDIDCGEIIDELEKVDTEEHYSIPESIANICSQCFYFSQDSFIKETSGFCTFYHLDVKVNGRCYAYQLAEEGKVSIDEINQNLNKSNKESSIVYKEQLDDESLPQKLICDYCNANIKLSESEQLNRTFQCSECGKRVNISEEVRLLEKSFIEKTDSELFEILINHQDFKTEYLYAARKEIKKRAIDLATNEEFLTMLSEY